MISSIDARTAVLNVAAAHTWVREIGANRGQAVEAILQRVHLPAGNPWCAAFIAYVGWSVFDKVWPLPRVGGCVSLFEGASMRSLIRPAPERGSIFLSYSSSLKRFAHTGFCTADPDPHGKVSTVEGNTSPDGSREGTGVFERVRTFGPRDRFIAWWA